MTGGYNPTTGEQFSTGQLASADPVMQALSSYSMGNTVEEGDLDGFSDEQKKEFWAGAAQIDPARTVTALSDEGGVGIEIPVTGEVISSGGVSGSTGNRLLDPDIYKDEARYNSDPVYKEAYDNYMSQVRTESYMRPIANIVQAGEPIADTLSNTAEGMADSASRFNRVYLGVDPVNPADTGIAGVLSNNMEGISSATGAGVSGIKDGMSSAINTWGTGSRLGAEGAFGSTTIGNVANVLMAIPGMAQAVNDYISSPTPSKRATIFNAGRQSGMSDVDISNVVDGMFNESSEFSIPPLATGVNDYISTPTQRNSGGMFNY